MRPLPEFRACDIQMMMSSKLRDRMKGREHRGLRRRDMQGNLIDDGTGSSQAGAGNGQAQTTRREHRGLRRRDMQGNLIDDGTGSSQAGAGNGQPQTTKREHRGLRRRDMQGNLIDDGTGQGPAPSGGPAGHPASPARPAVATTGGSGASSPEPAGTPSQMQPNSLGGGLYSWYKLNPNPMPKGYYAEQGKPKPPSTQASTQAAAKTASAPPGQSTATTKTTFPQGSQSPAAPRKQSQISSLTGMRIGVEPWHSDYNPNWNAAYEAKARARGPAAPWESGSTPPPKPAAAPPATKLRQAPLPVGPPRGNASAGGFRKARGGMK